MPHLDYCSKTYCYFPKAKATLQKIYNTHNYIMSKLLNLNATIDANNLKVFFLRIMISINFITDYLSEWQLFYIILLISNKHQATFVQFCSKFINNILENLKNNFYTFRKLSGILVKKKDIKLFIYESLYFNFLK